MEPFLHSTKTFVKRYIYCIYVHSNLCIHKTALYTSHYSSIPRSPNYTNKIYQSFPPIITAKLTLDHNNTSVYIYNPPSIHAHDLQL